jgi:methionyl-tRNA synthetase
VKYLVTSALPYINGIKHLGNLVGSLLPADIYTRYLKQEGHEAIYICGTDEHGTPAELAAEEKGLGVADFCREMFRTQREIYEQFDIDFSYFGRSSDPSNHSLTQEVFLDLWKHGFIEERTIPSYYSQVDGRHLPDRYIEGTCPRCGYEKARGDQCDRCGALLDPAELKDPYSALSGDRNLELKQEKHLFLNLAKLQGEVAAWLETKQHWSRLVLGIAESWMSEGLKSRCITRSLDWGVKVPLAGYEDKVFYVWFDAPLGYISFTMDWAKAQGQDWRSWWQSPETQIVQFMAKDNVPFHAVFWPAMMLGTRGPWTLPTTIKSFSWLNYEKGKFSTSQKRGVFTDQALTLFEADYWRYGLMALAPEATDSDFTFQDFADAVNKDLADKFGNFVNRVLTFTLSKLGGVIERPFLTVDSDLAERVAAVVSAYRENMEALRFRASVGSLRDAWALGNEFFAASEPWKKVKVDADEARRIIGQCLYLAGLFAVLSYPFIPRSAGKVWSWLGLGGRALKDVPVSDYDALWAQVEAVHVSPDVGILFKKIPPEQIAELTAAFQGSGS